MFEKSGYRLGGITDEFQVKRVQRVRGLMVIGISEKCCVRDHDSWDTVLPEGGVVAQTHFGEFVTASRYDELLYQ